jgi:rubrerythrin
MSLKPFEQKIEKWMRALRDNVIAEEGAIKQYTSQLQEFIDEAGLQALINPKNLIQALAPKNEQEYFKAAASALMIKYEIPFPQAQEIVDLIRKLLVGSPEIRADPEKNHSLQQIAREETDHFKEFTKWIEVLGTRMKELLESI